MPWIRGLAVAGALVLGALSLGGPVAAEPVLGAPQARFVADEATGGWFEVVGLGGVDLEALRSRPPSSSEWGEILTVNSLDETGEVTPRAMLGNVRTGAEGLRFEPRFPPVRGLSYRIRLDLDALRARLPGASSPRTSADDGAVFETIVTVPATDAPTVVIEQVYPSVDRVPANLLKIYLHFSGAMARGEVYRWVKLYGPDGEEVAAPFLEIDEELWDRGQRRLTLFFDPGRIKRGLRPHAEHGPPLRAGGSFRMTIDGAWPDAFGRPLGAGYEKVLEVMDEDREAPRMAAWQVAEPAAGTHDPLIVTFAEPLDHALALRMIRVERAAGQVLDGVAMLQDQERVWHFVPTEPWQPGTHRLSVDGALEDLAGNSLRGAFDRDVSQGESEQRAARFARPFAVGE